MGVAKRAEGQAALSLATIGYEGAALDAFLGTLVDAGIKTLIDVREVAFSRRKAFCKSALKEAVAEAGIAYVHLRALGTPKPGRDAARAGRMAEFRKLFDAQLSSAEAQSALDEALDLARDGAACLMCYERDPQRCHRSIVAAEMAKRERIETSHLTVQPIAVGTERSMYRRRPGESV